MREPIWQEDATGARTIDGRLDDFVEGASFQHVEALWHFDNVLRMLILVAIEHVEVSLRTSCAHESGKRGAFAHLDENLMDGKFTQERTGESGEPIPSRHEIWVGEIRAHQRERDDDFVVHHEVKYGGDLPIWKLVEILQFGQLIQLYRGLPWAEKVVIASGLNASDPEVLSGWASAMNSLRNKAAHQARLWNASLDTPKRAKGIHRLEHLRSLPKSDRKIYPYLCVLRHWMLETAPSSPWHAQLLEHLKAFPEVPFQSLRSAGFPDDWEILELWA